MATRVANYLGILVIASMPAWPAQADPVEDFYKKNPITIVAGYTPGGGFDLYTRMLAGHIGKYIPGNPSIVVQNMPGAGSLKATNYMYSVAPKDGSTFALARAPVMETLTGTSSSAFEATKFTWLGNGTGEFSICALLGNPKVKTMADAAKYPFTVAGTGPGSDEDMFTRILAKLFDLKAQLVSGYPAGAEMLLAVERGEVDGRCGWSYSSLKAAKPDWVTEKKLKILTALSLERSPELPDTPAVMEFVTTERQRQILRLVINIQNLGRPFFGPPGIPADRAAALRTAFERTMKDPAFVADMTARKLEVNPMGWREIDTLLKEFEATPKDVVDEVRAIIAGK
jgi:tripartite-type tricarboxylate transporter receptor subunit TctC